MDGIRNSFSSSGSLNNSIDGSLNNSIDGIFSGNPTSPVANTQRDDLSNTRPAVRRWRESAFARQLRRLVPETLRTLRTLRTPRSATLIEHWNAWAREEGCQYESRREAVRRMTSVIINRNERGDLDLKNLNLSSLPENLPENVRNLDVSENQLTSLPKLPGKVKEVYAMGNPFSDANDILNAAKKCTVHISKDRLPRREFVKLRSAAVQRMRMHHRRGIVLDQRPVENRIDIDVGALPRAVPVALTVLAPEQE